MISVVTVTLSDFLSDVFSRQKKERSVLPGIGSLKLVAEPEPPLLLELQPAHRLPQGAAISANDTQSGTCSRGGRWEGTRMKTNVSFKMICPVKQQQLMCSVCIWYHCVPLRKENFLRNPGVTKESAKQSRRPLKSSPAVLVLTEWGLELAKHSVACRSQQES